MRRPPSVAAILLLTLPALAAADGPYAVRQFRPSHVGDAFDCDVTAAQRVRHVRHVAGQPEAALEVARTVHLLGRCTVRAVDAHGSCTTLDCRVSQLDATLDANPAQPLLPPGAIVEVTQSDGAPQFHRLDGPLPPGCDRSLALVLTAYPADAPTPDDLYPPGHPRAVGESWPIDPAQDAAARRLAHAPPATHVAGHATLVGPATVAGQPCLLVKHVSDVDGPVPATRPLGVTSAHRNALSVSTAALPLDPAQPPLDIVAQDTVDYDVHGTVPQTGQPFDEQTHVVTDTHLTRSVAHH